MANPPLLFAYVRSSVTPRIHHRLPHDISHRYRRHRPVTPVTFIGPRLPFARPWASDVTLFISAISGGPILFLYAPAIRLDATTILLMLSSN